MEYSSRPRRSESAVSIRKEVMRKTQKSVEDNNAGSEVIIPSRNNDKSETVTKLVDFLAEYICDNVTGSLKAVQKAIEKRMIIRALKETGGNQAEAAKILGLKPTTLIYKIRKYEIQIKKTLFLNVDGDKV